MRRLTTTSLLIVGLLAGGSAADTASASATPTSVTASVSNVPASDGAQTVSLVSSVREHQSMPELGKRRYRNRRYSGVRTTRRRSFLSRIFGFLGFLLCLPLLLVLVIALVVMMRRSSRRREDEMMRRQYPDDRYPR